MSGLLLVMLLGKQLAPLCCHVTNLVIVEGAHDNQDGWACSSCDSAGRELTAVLAARIMVHATLLQQAATIGLAVAKLARPHSCLSWSADRVLDGMDTVF